MALLASARRLDLFARTVLNDLQAALGRVNSDTPETFALVRQLVVDMSAIADKMVATAWRGEVYGRFGPAGTMMKGLLKRRDPRFSGC